MHGSVWKQCMVRYAFTSMATPFVGCAASGIDWSISAAAEAPDVIALSRIVSWTADWRLRSWLDMMEDISIRSAPLSFYIG